MPQEKEQVILLPPRGMTTGEGESPKLENFFLSLARPMIHAAAAGIRVLDSICDTGAKLIEIDRGAQSVIRAMQPGVRVIPVVYHRIARAPRPEVRVRPGIARASRRLVLRFVSRRDGAPVAGADVLAFFNYAEREGFEKTTNSRGEVALPVTRLKKLDRLYVYPARNYWSLLKKNVPLPAQNPIALSPIDPGFADALRFFHRNADSGFGAGVTVGVIDTGVARHRDLRIDGGENTVTGERSSDFGDNGLGHGTHVAGIIAGSGTSPAGIRGLAPAVRLRSYRVFGKGSDRASNFAIAKAIDKAVADGCDFINMSLGGGAADEATREAISDARARGALVIAAAGNDQGGPVNFPAADSLAIAVSAMGRKGTFPAGTEHVDEVGKPQSRTDPRTFFAKFSNMGPEIDLIGPGVAIISTVPRGYAAWSGTSMACPAVTGAAARLLSATPAVLEMARTEARSRRIAELVFAAAKSAGFGVTFEGQGRVIA